MNLLNNNTTVFLETWGEGDFGLVRGVEETTVSDIYKDIINSLPDIEIDSVESLYDVAREFYELGGPAHIYTKEEWEKEEAERERAEIEPYVARVAAAHKVDARDTIAVLNAISRELGRFESYREGMMEDGLCIGWGVTPDQWYDERNASMGDTMKAERAIDWIAANAPLAYAQWCESEHGE